MTRRSENVPESPSSALQTMYFCGAFAARTVRAVTHLDVDTEQCRRAAERGQDCAPVDAGNHDAPA